MLVTLPIALLGAMTVQRAWVLAFHAIAIVALIRACRPPGAGPPRVILDWLPLALLPALYAELPYLMAAAAGGVARFRDLTVIGWEEALLGGQPARSLAGLLPYQWLSELLHFGYLSYYALVFVPPLLLYLARRREEFALSATAVMASFAICFLVFVTWPVEGPRYRHPAPVNLPDGPVRSLVLLILERGSSRGAAFPSSHAAAAVAQSVILWRVWPAAAIPVSILTLLLVVGAVYGGFHYGIDMLAGTVTGAAVAAGVLRLRRQRDPASRSIDGMPVTDMPALRFGDRLQPPRGPDRPAARDVRVAPRDEAYSRGWPRA